MNGFMKKRRVAAAAGAISAGLCLAALTARAQSQVPGIRKSQFPTGPTT